MLVNRQLHVPAAFPPGDLRYPLCRRLGGSQGRSGRGGEEKTSQLLSGLEPPIIQPVALALNPWSAQIMSFLIMCFSLSCCFFLRRSKYSRRHKTVYSFQPSLVYILSSAKVFCRLRGSGEIVSAEIDWLKDDTMNETNVCWGMNRWASSLCLVRADNWVALRGHVARSEFYWRPLNLLTRTNWSGGTKFTLKVGEPRWLSQCRD
jgi:hypothetical protein